MTYVRLGVYDGAIGLRCSQDGCTAGSEDLIPIGINPAGTHVYFFCKRCGTINEFEL